MSDTVSKFFEQKSSLVPSKRSTLSLAEVCTVHFGLLSDLTMWYSV